MIIFMPLLINDSEGKMLINQELLTGSTLQYLTDVCKTISSNRKRKKKNKSIKINVKI